MSSLVGTLILQLMSSLYLSLIFFAPFLCFRFCSFVFFARIDFLSLFHFFPPVHVLEFCYSFFPLFSCLWVCGENWSSNFIASSSPLPLPWWGLCFFTLIYWINVFTLFLSNLFLMSSFLCSRFGQPTHYELRMV